MLNKFIFIISVIVAMQEVVCTDDVDDNSEDLIRKMEDIIETLEGVATKNINDALKQLEDYNNLLDTADTIISEVSIVLGKMAEDSLALIRKLVEEANATDCLLNHEEVILDIPSGLVTNHCGEEHVRKARTVSDEAIFAIQNIKPDWENKVKECAIESTRMPCLENVLTEISGAIFQFPVTIVYQLDKIRDVVLEVSKNLSNCSTIYITGARVQINSVVNKVKNCIKTVDEI